MTTAEATPTPYISHHLANCTISFGDSPCWTLHLDTLVTSVVLGVLAFGFLWLVVRGATAGVPGKRQAFVKLVVNFRRRSGHETHRHACSRERSGFSADC